MRACQKFAVVDMLILDESAEADKRNVQDLEVKEWFCRKEEII